MTVVTSAAIVGVVFVEAMVDVYPMSRTRDRSLGSHPEGTAPCCQRGYRPGIAAADSGYGGAMFLFFSNRAGCLPSLLISALITLVLLVVTGIVDL